MSGAGAVLYRGSPVECLDGYLQLSVYTHQPSSFLRWTRWGSIQFMLYSVSHEVCTQFCSTKMFCCVSTVALCGILWFIYPNSWGPQLTWITWTSLFTFRERPLNLITHFSGSLFWHWVNLMDILCAIPCVLVLNTWRPRQNGRHFPDDIFKWIFFNENVWISINISLKFVPRGPINNIPTLVPVMAWRQPGNKPLSEPMIVSLPTHICVAQPHYGIVTLHGVEHLGHHWFRLRLMSAWYLY